MAKVEAIEGFQRIVLLNHLISRSATHAPNEFKPPAHPAKELLEILQKRRTRKVAVEYLGSGRDANNDEPERIAKGAGHNFIRLSQFRFDQVGDRTFAVMLFEYVDFTQSSFPVVDTVTFDGREIAGKTEERGAAAAHVVVRLPDEGEYDDRRYRCAIEAVHSVTRNDIERFLCRQLRRQSHQEGWNFSVEVPPKGQRKKAVEREYQYSPRLELIADASRKVEHASSDGKILTQMTFTKRGEKQSVGRPTQVKHEEIVADIEYKIVASQGPDDPKERNKWAQFIRDYYRGLGFDERLYFRHIKGASLSGSVHQDLAGASDLLMCPRELIFLSKEPKRWHPTINRETIEQMIELLNRDQLWLASQ